MIRIGAVVNKVSPANPSDCLEEIKQALSELPEGGCDIAVLPALALCSPSAGDLFGNRALTGRCSAALEELCAMTEAMDSYLIAGTVVDDWGKAVSAMALLYRGRLVALISALDSPVHLAEGNYSEDILPPNTVFACGGLRFCVLSCGFQDLASNCVQLARTGCDLIIVPCYEPVYAGLTEEIRSRLRGLSAATGCAVVMVNGGVGDTSSPYMYRGFAGIFECGEELAWKRAGSGSFHAVADLDGDVIRSRKRSRAFVQPKLTVRPAEAKPGLMRTLRKNPFLQAENPGAYLEDLFDLQSRSLAARMENTGITKLVLAVSGGLDSTAALLASVRAVELLGLPRENIVGVTLPGFGTSDSTYYNALSLLERLGVTRRDISIKAAVRQHFEDIGHSGAKDTTYENAQARERTQVILDIANMVGGLMVGTGDLSEEALGFCTFSGDHLANYNVNSCITKTVLRELVSHIAEKELVEGVSDVLRAVLDTPVSPELLPLGESGEIRQKTEEILGPYLLHDFFLYYFIAHRFSPSKIFHYACAAFEGEMEPAFIREKLKLFIRRFCAGQFKRSCAPDAAGITEVNLCGVNYYIPSDLDPSFLLGELEQA